MGKNHNYLLILLISFMATTLLQGGTKEKVITAEQAEKDPLACYRYIVQYTQDKFGSFGQDFRWYESFPCDISILGVKRGFSTRAISFALTCGGRYSLPDLEFIMRDSGLCSEGDFRQILKSLIRDQKHGIKVDSYLSDLVEGCCNNRYTGIAKKITELIAEPSQNPWNTFRLIEAFVNAGDVKRTSDYLKHELRSAKQENNIWLKAGYFAKIASAYFEIGKRDDALECADLAVEAFAREKEGRENYWLSATADIFWKSGQTEKALKALALMDKRTVGSSGDRRLLAETYLKWNLPDSALSIMFGSASHFDDFEELEFCRAACDLGFPDIAMTVAITIAKPEYKETAFIKIANQMAKSGANDSAISLLKLAIPLINGIEDCINRTERLVEISLGLFESGDSAASHTLLSHCRSELEQSEFQSEPERSLRTRSLAAVAYGLLMTHDLAGAQQIFSENNTPDLKERKIREANEALKKTGKDLEAAEVLRLWNANAEAENVEAAIASGDCIPPEAREATKKEDSISIRTPEAEETAKAKTKIDCLKYLGAFGQRECLDLEFALINNLLKAGDTIVAVELLFKIADNICGRNGKYGQDTLIDKTAGILMNLSNSGITFADMGASQTGVPFVNTGAIASFVGIYARQGAWDYCLNAATISKNFYAKNCILASLAAWCYILQPFKGEEQRVFLRKLIALSQN